jgi:hypothetical protein
MPTEAEVVIWVANNWPSLILTGILVRAYMKLQSFLNEIVELRHDLNRLARRQNRQLIVCSETHPEKGRFLYDDPEEMENK